MEKTPRIRRKVQRGPHRPYGPYDSLAAYLRSLPDAKCPDGGFGESHSDSILNVGTRIL